MQELRIKLNIVFLFIFPLLLNGFYLTSMTGHRLCDVTAALVVINDNLQSGSQYFPHCPRVTEQGLVHG